MMLSVRLWLVAGFFGIAAWGMLYLELTFTIPGTQTITDPRELFVTLGSALTGPAGGILIGLLAGAGSPAGVRLASIVAHILGAVWVGIGYKKWVSNNASGFDLIRNWVFLVLFYYYVILMNVFLVGLLLFHQRSFSYGDMYLNLIRGTWLEILLTILVTSLVMYALPRKARRALW